jgi:hypothetical protein
LGTRYRSVLGKKSEFSSVCSYQRTVLAPVRPVYENLVQGVSFEACMSFSVYACRYPVRVPAPIDLARVNTGSVGGGVGI